MLFFYNSNIVQDKKYLNYKTVYLNIKETMTDFKSKLDV